MNPKKHIQTELEDSGMRQPEDWRDALDTETDDEEVSSGNEVEIVDVKKFSKLFAYIGEAERIPDRKKVTDFGKTADSLERLQKLLSMSLEEAAECIRDAGLTEGAFHYLVGRLEFYQKLIQGKATKKHTEKEWDDRTNGCVEVVKEEPIDASVATPQTVKLGLLRDIMFASMIGTPEVAIFKISTRQCKDRQIPTTHFPLVKGFHSGTSEHSIGYAYPFLRKLYEQARSDVARRRGEEKIEPQVLEHRAIMLASRWLTESMNYNPSGRGPQSPYVSSNEEAIAWARLGEGVKKQLRGMRQKLQGVDLHKIERFVGKSGVDKYDPERKRLFGQIKFLKESYDQEKKQEFTTRENQFAAGKQTQWQEREIERLTKKLEKSRKEIEEANLPEDEVLLQLESIETKYSGEISRIKQEVEEKVAYFQSRSTEQLVCDLEERQKLVEQRHEKRKSLAQKALDLHFALNFPRKTGVTYEARTFTGSRYTAEERKPAPYADVIDWINYAPLGTIKRAHKMMRDGVDEKSIIVCAVTDIVCGVRGMSRVDMDLIGKMLEEDKNKISAMIKVGSIVSNAGYEVSVDEVIDMANKNFQGIAAALKLYDLPQVRQFLDKGVDLKQVATARKITQKYGHDLSPTEIEEIASHNINGLDEALRYFNLDGIRTLLKQDVNLVTATAVLGNTKQFGYELSLTQIVNIAKNVQDIGDFTSALSELSLAEVERIFSVGVTYHGFSQVRGALVKHDYPHDFNSTLAVAQKLARNNEYEHVDKILDFYDLTQLDMIIARGVMLANVLGVQDTIREKGVSSNLDEVIELTKYAGDYNPTNCLGQAIDTFGIDDVRKIVSKSCKLDKALEARKHIYGAEGESEIPQTLREGLRKGGLDTVIAVAKSGNIEIAVKTLEAGFTIEEITRFPFLISRLITKN